MSPSNSLLTSSLDFSATSFLLQLMLSQEALLLPDSCRNVLHILSNRYTISAIYDPGRHNIVHRKRHYYPRPTRGNRSSEQWRRYPDLRSYPPWKTHEARGTDRLCPTWHCLPPFGYVHLVQSLGETCHDVLQWPSL